jgi:hypothetical protein
MSEKGIDPESYTDPAHRQLLDGWIGWRLLATRDIRVGDVRMRRVTGYAFPVGSMPSMETVN